MVSQFSVSFADYFTDLRRPEKEKFLHFHGCASGDACQHRLPGCMSICHLKKKPLNAWRNDKDDANFPKLDLTKFEAGKLNGEGEILILATADSLDYLRQLESLMIERGNFLIIVERNRIAAQVMADEMTKQGVNHGAMIYGIWHSIPCEGGLSIQDHLARLGVSTIIIDPPGTKLQIGQNPDSQSPQNDKADQPSK